jgi:alkaline phosphatase
MTTSKALRWIGVLAVTAGLSATPALAGAHATKRHKHHSSIPQHNGGDHDADNRGGPSDGDGNI